MRMNALTLAVGIMLAHWIEHIVQAVQVWVYHLPRHHALGLLGFVWPALVHSEWLHFTYAALMLIFLWASYDRVASRGAGRWWLAAIVLQAWHMVEHTILLSQVMQGQPPLSLLQHIFPRIELHLFYNTVVTIPVMFGLMRYKREGDFWTRMEYEYQRQKRDTSAEDYIYLDSYNW